MGIVVGVLVVVVAIIAYFIFAGGEMPGTNDVNIKIEGAGDVVDGAADAIEGATTPSE
jgi:hypothetical protein